MRRLCLALLLAATAASAQESSFAVARGGPGDGPLSGLLRLRVAERAAGTRVVMVNEAHHDAASRLLTLRLLPVLYAQGYRYFAAEAFSPDIAETTVGGYPTPEAGSYVGEPIFGTVVREALRLGYTLVPCEIEDADPENADTTIPRQERRDSAQARHLAERTVERDPAARVLVHAGYGHVYEKADDHWHLMAAYFRERTGIDPLTVDQTMLSERSEPTFEHPRYRAAGAAGLLHDTQIVLADADGQPLAPVYNRDVDLQVLTPRTLYKDGRPAWPGLAGLTPAMGQILTDCSVPVCLVETLPKGEADDAVPVDRVIVEFSPFSIFVPRGARYVVRVRDGQTGERLHSPIHGDPPPPPRP